MGRITITIMKCDRCGSEHPADKINTGPEFGHSTVKWNGTIGGTTVQGDVGGYSPQGDAWLCLICTKGFLAWMEEGKAA